MAQYNPSTTYHVQDRVSFNDLYYSCLVDNPPVQNPEGSEYWTEAFVKLSDVLTIPYVEAVDKTKQVKNNTASMVISGYYFDSSIEVQIQDCTVSITSVTPGKIYLDVTTSSNTGVKNIQVTKNSVIADGISATLEIVDFIQGNGPAGTFLTNFDSGGTGTALWGSNWTLSIFGTINSIDQYFASSNSTTPSGTTGPDSSDDGTTYAFTESSNPNNGAGQYAIAETSNFKKIQSIEFDLHRFGSGHGNFDVEGYNGSTWITVQSYIGQTTAAQSDPFTHETITMSDFEKIRLVFNYSAATTSYAADTAIDNISIISTN